MEFLVNSNVNFMGVRRIFAFVSAILVILSIVYLFALQGLNLGIDFAGGTQLIVRFSQTPDINEVRNVLSQGGVERAQIQRFGDAEDNEIMIKTPLSGDDEEGNRAEVEAALSTRFDTGGGAIDLNHRGEAAISSFLLQRDPDGQRALGDELASEHYDEVAAAIMARRQRTGVLDSLDDLDGVDGVSEAVMSILRNEASVGGYAVLSAENVGPQIGSELRRKGILAVLFSIVGMLMYIWWRFELRFGLAAVVALAHDVTIALGLYALAGYEFNLTTIAAFLTLVGYSVNDTVIIFDRVRENLRLTRREPLVNVLNASLNQTLTRTILTSGTTLLVLGSLLFFGGDVLRGFSFVMFIGVIIGTYSSVFVASPVVLLWERLRRRQA